jgi:hypothetical protein
MPAKYLLTRAIYYDTLRFRQPLPELNSNRSNQFERSNKMDSEIFNTVGVTRDKNTTHIQLNPQQADALLSPDARKLVKGGEPVTFGSGNDRVSIEYRDESRS